ncbi:MAG: hypothetical protein IT260_08890 [Saprospiraceae bacterium]|nr:hypothetical protein [Saprospiraceae bacterium]
MSIVPYKVKNTTRLPRRTSLFFSPGRAVYSLLFCFFIGLSWESAAQKVLSFDGATQKYQCNVYWTVEHASTVHKGETAFNLDISQEKTIAINILFIFEGSGLPGENDIEWGFQVNESGGSITLPANMNRNRSTKKYLIVKATKGGTSTLTINPKVWRRVDVGNYTELAHADPIVLTFNLTDKGQAVPAPANTNKPNPAANRPNKPAPVQPAAPQISEEEKAYNEAVGIEEKSRRESALKSFVAKFGAKNANSPLVAKALRAIPLGQSQPTDNNDGTYTYTLTNAVELKIDSNSLRVQLEKTGFAAYKLTISGTSDTLNQLFITDIGKDAPYNQTKTLKFKERVIVTLVGQDSDSFRIKVSGGTAPFIVFLSQNGFPRERYEITKTDSVFALSKAACKICEDGAHTLEVYDSENSTQLFSSTDAIDIEKTNYILNFLKIVGILLILTFVVIRLRQARQKRLYEDKLRQKKARQPEPPAATTPVASPTPAVAPPPVAAAPAAPPAITGQDLERLQETLAETEAAATEPPAQPKMAIKIRTDSKSKQEQSRRKFIPAEAMQALLRDNKHYTIDCRDMWPDTTLTHVHLNQHTITGLDRFLRTQNIHEITETDNMVPEIGGFLLGLIHETEQSCEVFVEEFVPISPESHNTFRLEFSTESLVNDLGDIQDKYPNSGLLGWFHTHPGHGLFLSSPDMAIHEGFFKEKYQFAMIIDSLSPDLDTGFFTRKHSSDMNNQDGQAADEKWLAWTEIEKTIRRKDS